MTGNPKIVMLRGEKGDTGATGDYAGILNKPQINGVTLDGNKSASNLGLATASEQQNLISTVSGLGDDISEINNVLDDLGDDITALQANEATRPFIVTADYDNTTKAISNASATVTQVCAAVSANRPCYIHAKEASDRIYVIRCVYAASPVAYFTRDAIGICDTWIYINGAFEYISDAATRPLIVTADYTTSTRALSNFSASAEDMWRAVRTEKRPCFLYCVEDSYTYHVAQCAYVNYDYNNGKYTAVFVNSSDGNDDTFVVTDGVGGTTATHRSDFSQYVFSAASGVSAAESFYRKNMTYALRFNANGTFSGGSVLLGTYSGAVIDSNGVIGACAIRTGSNGANYDAIGTFNLAEDGTLRVYYNGTFTGVAISCAYIWPF